MDVTCGLNRKKMEIHGRCHWEALKEGDGLEGLGVNGRILFKCILNKRMEGRGMNSSNSG
jgi:hypothetical protein